MGDTFDYALTKATADVEATLNWMLQQGATITRESGSESESFGNVLVELTLDDAVVLITRDRGQWMLDVQVGELPRFDFDVVHRGLTGDDQWSSDPGRLPTQLPDGVSWREELPRTLEWLRSTPDAERRLQRLQRKRAKQIFG